MTHKRLIAAVSLIAVALLALWFTQSFESSDADYDDGSGYTSELTPLDSTETVVAIQADNWFEGGTLHQGVGTDWTNASIDNKLATASDWVAAFPKIQSAYAASNDMSLLRPFALALVECLDQSSIHNSDTALTQLTANCALDMKWN